MGIAVPQTSDIFSLDQRIAFEALYWDTTSTAVRLGSAFSGPQVNTAFGAGIEFAMFDLYDAEFSIPTGSASAKRSALEAALNNTGVTGSVLGYDGDDTYHTGVIQNIYQYWGAGAPPGGRRAKQVLLKYSGYVTDAVAQGTLAFCGQGSVVAIVTRTGSGTQELICAGLLKEPNVRIDLVNTNPTTVIDEWGYQLNTAPMAFAAGDKIEIYYWHNGEPWGGIAAKILPFAASSDFNFLEELRYAAVVGTSFISNSPTALAATDVPYIASATLTVKEKAVSELQLTVPLVQATESDGYYIEKNNQEISLVDNANTLTKLQKNRTIHFAGGFLNASGTEEIYPRFTGYIDDIFPDPEGNSATITCRSFEGKLTEPADENNPDRLAYHAAGFILREQAGDPVYPIPAYDAWPLEVAISDLMWRAGIDSFNLGYDITSTTHYYGKWAFLDTVSQEPYFGHRMFRVRGLAEGDPISFDRQPNYGNIPPLFKDYLPKDDSYLFPPVVTQRIFDRVSALTDHFGYDCYFDATGQCVFSGRNNPVEFQYATKPGTYSPTTPSGTDQRVAVSAVGGIVLHRQHSAGAWSRVIEGHFSRLDLYAGIGEFGSLNGGVIGASIEVNDGAGNWTVVDTRTANTYAEVGESFYYDGAIHRDGSNAALFRILALPFDHYRVTLSGLGPASADAGASDCVYRVNGVAVYERDPDVSYYNESGVERTFTTLGNITKLTPESASKDQRNMSIVVGGRKATITDSAKLDAAPTSNPNNPEQEFYVSVSVDPFSIYDPTSPTFSGSKRVVVIFNDAITDSQLARWLTRTILFRYQSPLSPATFDHTALPSLQLRDAVHVVEERHGAIDHTLWVKGYTEKWSSTEAITTVECAASPELPSYQPREDIDIDELFPSPVDGLGIPAIDVKIGYKNIHGQMVGNADVDTIPLLETKARGSSKPMTAEQVVSGSSIVAAHVAIPETVYLGWHINDQPQSTTWNRQVQRWASHTRRALVNNPYRKFWDITSWSAGHLPTLTFDFQEGDGTAGIYDKTYYSFPGTDWYLCYDYLRARTGKNPYYDPYTSELGNLVNIDFTLLVGGKIRVTVMDANKGNGYETPVAWLTAPGSDPEVAEAHWVSVDAGDQSFSWDGVDNIGYYNTLHTLTWAEEMKGTFGEKPVNIGKGWLVANDSTTNRHTQIGDLDGNNFAKDNSPYFTIGQYSKFYIKIEVLNDNLLRKDVSSVGIPEPREVNTTDLATQVTPTSGGSALTINDVAETYVWTHLPSNPTQVAIRIQEWAGSGSWVPGMATNPVSDWTDYSTPNMDASIKVGSPVRLTFVPQPHRGKMWEDSNGDLDPTLVSGMLTRQVHLKATIWDQFWAFAGKTWEEFDPKFIVGATENKSVNNRMFHNEDHTLEFEDSTYRTGDAFFAYEWVFDPSLFEKDFGRGFKEKLRYADYEQLESLPGFDPKRLGGTAVGERSSMIMAFMSYIFAFSAFVTDRSGRRQWCLNSWTDDAGKKRGFIDKTKIVTSTIRGASPDPSSGSYAPKYIVDFPEQGGDTYLRRSIFMRQWKESFWTSSGDSRSPVSLWNITNPHQLKYVQLYAYAFDPFYGHLADSVNADEDTWLTEYQRTGSGVSQNIRLRSGQYLNAVNKETVPAVLVGLSNTNLVPRSFGSWDFDRTGVDGFFKPDPSRDFHPYWRYPFMPDWAAYQTWSFNTSMEQDNAIDVLSGASSHFNYPLRDLAAPDLWYGYAFSEAYAQSQYNAHPEKTMPRRRWLFGARLEGTVEEIGAQGPNQLDDTDYMTEQGIAAMFNYRKQDELDRWDQFRGVISRSAYADRTAAYDTTWSDKDLKRAASPQPVKPSGTYLLNTARYSDYILATTSRVRQQFPPVHWASWVQDWFDIRFHHEYVWYSDRHFPILSTGAAAYMFTGDEYTKVSGWVQHPWVQNVGTVNEQGVSINPPIFYDAGAWTGWKPDASINLDKTGLPSWTSKPFLRWAEIFPTCVQSFNLKPLHHASGGYWDSFSPTGQSVHTDATFFLAALDDEGGPWNYARVNIFDEYFTLASRARLAVGPEVETQRNMIMNLTLPDRLRGE